jgi:hypothetical protein
MYFACVQAALDHRLAPVYNHLTSPTSANVILRGPAEVGLSEVRIQLLHKCQPHYIAYTALYTTLCVHHILRQVSSDYCDGAVHCTIE